LPLGHLRSAAKFATQSPPTSPAGHRIKPGPIRQRADNCGMIHCGVSLLREVLAGSSPASIRRLSQTAVTQFRP
jgi:hypothetical protein